MISLDYYTTLRGKFGATHSISPCIAKGGGGTTHYHYHYPNHHSWGPLKTWSCCSPTLLASIFRFDLKKEKPRLAQRFFSCLEISPILRPRAKEKLPRAAWVLPHSHAPSTAAVAQQFPLHAELSSPWRSSPVSSQSFSLMDYKLVMHR